MLIAVEIVRSTVSFGINTFVSLYWIRELGASPALGGTALALVLGGGVLGTLLGGRIADRFGLVRTVQLGNALLLPALAALLLCRDPYAALGAGAGRRRRHQHPVRGPDQARARTTSRAAPARRRA